MARSAMSSALKSKGRLGYLEESGDKTHSLPNLFFPHDFPQIKRSQSFSEFRFTSYETIDDSLAKLKEIGVNLLAINTDFIPMVRNSSNELTRLEFFFKSLFSLCKKKDLKIAFISPNYQVKIHNSIAKDELCDHLVRKINRDDVSCYLGYFSYTHNESCINKTLIDIDEIKALSKAVEKFGFANPNIFVWTNNIAAKMQIAHENFPALNIYNNPNYEIGANFITNSGALIKASKAAVAYHHMMAFRSDATQLEMDTDEVPPPQVQVQNSHAVDSHGKKCCVIL